MQEKKKRNRILMLLIVGMLLIYAFTDIENVKISRGRNIFWGLVSQNVLKQAANWLLPGLTYVKEGRKDTLTGRIEKSVLSFVPISEYVRNHEEPETTVEDTLTRTMILENQANDENAIDENGNLIPAGSMQESVGAGVPEENAAVLASTPVQDIDMNQLNDYESLALVAKDEELNNVIYNETTNTTVINHSEDKLVVVNGTEDIVVVNTDDAVYIKSKNAKHNIKDFIVNVKKKFGKYTDRLHLYYRAWGTYQILSEGLGYKVKKVTVFPNKKMSLHKHSYRSEHWSVVEGVALIELEGITMEFEAGENVYVPAEAYHRISNESNENVVIIEVEIGDYLNEQDIVSKNYKDLGDVSKEIIKLSPVFKDYLWGGNRLVTEFDKNCDYDVVAESWELSAHKAGNSIVTNGRYKGLEFGKYLEQIEDDVVGWKCVAFEQFPMLIKFIDAKKPLSIQVHPDDDFAMSVEKEYGKNEMWYIMDCDEDAFVYCGFKEDITKEEIKTRIENHTITDVLNKIYVKKGDAIYIPAGTVHAIGSGILICEIQQSSNSTYRLYDYDRKDKDGNLRELHIEKALQVINTNK